MSLEDCLFVTLFLVSSRHSECLSESQIRGRTRLTDTPVMSEMRSRLIDIHILSTQGQDLFDGCVDSPQTFSK